jgi:hypothetical protein
MQKKKINNHHFLEGVWVGKRMLKNIDKTHYGTIENAILKKKELAQDLKEQFNWTEDEPELSRVLGIIEGLESQLE